MKNVDGDTLFISSFSLHFLILSPFPLHFLILTLFSHSQAGRLAQLVQPWTAKIVNDDDDNDDDDDSDDDKLEEAEKLFKVFAEAASKKWNSG